PAARLPPPSRSSYEAGGKCERSKNEEMIVLAPAVSRQNGCGKREGGKAPEIRLASGRVTTTALRAQHGHRSGNDRDDSQQDVNAHDRQEHRIGGRNRNSGDGRRPVAHGEVTG